MYVEVERKRMIERFVTHWRLQRLMILVINLGFQFRFVSPSNKDDSTFRRERAIVVSFA